MAAGIGVPLGIAALGEAATYAVATSAVAFVPLVGIGAAWGMAKAKKNNREREARLATASCLGEHGYAVGSWKVAKKRDLKLARQKAAAQLRGAPDDVPVHRTVPDPAGPEMAGNHSPLGWERIAAWS